MQNVFLIDPLADVLGVMGKFCSDSMKGSVTILLKGLCRAALMHIDKFV